MSKKYSNWYEEYKAIIKASLVSVIWQRIDKHSTLLEDLNTDINTILKNKFDAVGSFQKLATYKKEIRKKTSQLPKSAFQVPDQEFERFEKESSDHISKLPQKVSENQSKERFNRQESDTALLVIRKSFKRLGYGISKWPEKISNIFRKIRGKEKKTLSPWKHDIYVRDFADFYLKAGLKGVLSEAISVYYSAISRSSIELWLKDEAIDKEVSQNFEYLSSSEVSNVAAESTEINLNAVKTTIEDLVFTHFESQWTLFQTNYEKAGTIEFSNSSVSAAKSEKVTSRFTKSYESINSGWINTLHVLQDDWEIDIELYELIYSSLHLFYTSKASTNDKLEGTVFKELDLITKYLTNCKDQIDSIPTEKKVLTFLEKESAHIEIELNNLVESNSEVILSQDLPQIVDKIGTRIQRKIEKISGKRVVYKGSNYTKPIKTSSLSSISPYELINFECAPNLFKAVEEIKQSTTYHLNQAQNTLLNLTEIARFNLDSAVSAINENDDQKGKIIALAGLDRTIEQIEKVKEELSKIILDLDEKLFVALKIFNGSVVRFTDNENILELRVRIMKAKATERGKKIRKQIVEGIKNLFPILFRVVRMYFSKVKLLVQGNLKKLGIGVDKINITTELADFLAQTEEAIDQLPFVYQRLFRAAPLVDDNFFEGRVKELNLLKEAYEQWEQKRFAATIITGEKGSGISTLINLFIQNSDKPITSVKVSLDHNINTSEELLTVFNTALGWKIEDLSALAVKLKSGKRLVIVLENLQRLYLMRVGGFENIKSITELISITSDKVFWVVGCTQFGHDYLDKTIRLSENFGYAVQLESLSSTAIVELIERRHNVSGYNLQFEASSEDLISKRFNGLTEEEQQVYLKKEFFSDLNKIAKSNISIALIYWLRSTKQDSENTISISSLKELDFSFLKGLSLDKLYILHMLLLHDGLTESEISKINNLGISQCRRLLYPLFEDGIIIRNDAAYQINPLLYRQSVNLLKTKNILH